MVLVNETININIFIGKRNIPATIVNGSPIIGTQHKNKDHFPYFENHLDALVNCNLFKGNHFLSLNFVR